MIAFLGTGLLGANFTRALLKKGEKVRGRTGLCSNLKRFWKWYPNLEPFMVQYDTVFLESGGSKFLPLYFNTPFRSCITKTWLEKGWILKTFDWPLTPCYFDLWPLTFELWPLTCDRHTHRQTHFIPYDPPFSREN